MIKKYGLENTVTIEGGMTQDELKEAYKTSAIFALPSYIVESGDRDGIPNVLAEAMATGRAVVSTSISGIPEIVESGVNGLLVGQKNATALAEALEQLLKNPDLRKCLGDNARETIQSIFDSQATTIFLKDLFVTCLERRSEKQSTTATKNPVIAQQAPVTE